MNKLPAVSVFIIQFSVFIGVPAFPFNPVGLRIR
jgi:hypothetical protein